MGFVVDKAALGQVSSDVLRFPLPILISFIAPHSSPSISQGWYSRPVVVSVIFDSVPPHPKRGENFRTVETMYKVNAK
jgi:hypothetical protein